MGRVSERICPKKVCRSLTMRGLRIESEIWSGWNIFHYIEMFGIFVVVIIALYVF
jgi:hypothetical protein